MFLIILPKLAIVGIRERKRGENSSIIVVGEDNGYLIKLKPELGALRNYQAN